MEVFFRPQIPLQRAGAPLRPWLIPTLEVQDHPRSSKATDELILKPFGPWGAEAEQRAGLEASFGNDKIHLAIN